jgi:hypothetical protein
LISSRARGSRLFGRTIMGSLRLRSQQPLGLSSRSPSGWAIGSARSRPEDQYSKGHRLLPQPGGFEGLGLRRIEDPPHDLSLPEREGKRVRRSVHLNPAAASTQTLPMNQRDDRLPPIDELNLSCFDVLPCRQPASPIGSNAGVAVVDPSGVDIAPIPAARSVPLDLGWVIKQEPLRRLGGAIAQFRPVLRKGHYSLRNENRGADRAPR